MARTDELEADGTDTEEWYRFGVLVGIGNLVFIALVVALLRVDLYLGLAFAIVASVGGGLAVTWYALSRR